MPRTSAATTTAPKPPAVPAVPSVSIPTETDERAEMFFLLGALMGRIDFAPRLTQLVISQTRATPQVQEGE